MQSGRINNYMVEEEGEEKGMFARSLLKEDVGNIYCPQSFYQMRQVFACLWL